MTLRTRLWLSFSGIILLAAAAIWINLPAANPLFGRDISLRQGLDLKGGVYLVYEADTSGIASEQVSDSLEGVRQVIENRVNALGVTEPEIRTGESGGKPNISVSLPGVTDVAKAREMLGKTANLEFISETGEVLASGSDIIANRTSAEPPQGVTGNTGLSSAANWQVKVTFTDEGKQKFATATANNIGKPIAIVLDGALISAPTVQDAITDGVAYITGNFTAGSAREFAQQLRSGALPVPITLVQEQTVGATLGSDAVAASLAAGVIALGLVALFMIAFYGWAGALAVVALTIYVVLNLAIFRLIPVVLTLAGIAGFVISIGVAVDTNILTFERLKEELRLGKSIPLAIKESFKRSWPSIRDSHVASLISSTIIFLFATGPVKGFAVVLAIGTLLSLFSAITVTRTFMMLVSGHPKLQKLLAIAKP
jgi:preprotein translocase subunit SecD